MNKNRGRKRKERRYLSHLWATRSLNFLTIFSLLLCRAPFRHSMRSLLATAMSPRAHVHAVWSFEPRWTYRNACYIIHSNKFHLLLVFGGQCNIFASEIFRLRRRGSMNNHSDRMKRIALFSPFFRFRFYLRRAAFSRESERTGNVRLIGPFVCPRKPKGMCAPPKGIRQYDKWHFFSFWIICSAEIFKVMYCLLLAPDASFLFSSQRPRP